LYNANPANFAFKKNHRGPVLQMYDDKNQAGAKEGAVDLYIPH
jgi:hypothetical protein